MRKQIVGASWKMHVNNLTDATYLAQKINEYVGNIGDVEIFILPTFPIIKHIADIFKGSKIGWGSQNICFEEKGAFTGEVPPQVLKDLGCTYAEIGHAERRHLFNETDEIVNKKVKLSLKYHLIPVVCIGETKDDKDNKFTKIRLKTQVLWALDGLEKDDIKKVIFAYEPVWAIGQQKSADASYVQDIHLYIRNVIKDEYGEKIGDLVRIIYGGSVTPESSQTLMRQKDIDGLFIGRFGLEPSNFKKIVEMALDSQK